VANERCPTRHNIGEYAVGKTLNNCATASILLPKQTHVEALLTITGENTAASA
jgi:hypothetical protein